VQLGLYQRAFAGYRKALEQFADAYCIQSRLAIRLAEQGRREEAFQHYRRAYELMPASFGRVESHCFGCESVFEGAEQQTLAERVFNDLLAKDPQKPQIHYLLGYLQKERGRYPEAVKRFSESVRLDPDYLNAWKHLNDLGARVYLAPAERDVARMKLLELDPHMRHVHYDLNSVGDLNALWVGVEKANAATKRAEPPLYRLKASAEQIEAAQATMPAEAREQMEQYEVSYESRSYDQLPTPPVALGKHRLIHVAARLADPPY
jgi:tetratricopeptide (TPR) repeat protein